MQTNNENQELNAFYMMQARVQKTDPGILPLFRPQT